MAESITIYLFPPERCKTEGGDLCVFPFSYDGKQYFECTRATAVPFISSKPWCATSYDHWSRVGNWSYCQQDCPTEGNESHEFNIILCMKQGVSRQGIDEYSDAYNFFNDEEHWGESKDSRQLIPYFQNLPFQLNWSLHLFPSSLFTWGCPYFITER